MSVSEIWNDSQLGDLYYIKAERFSIASLKQVTCLLHVPDADDVRPVLKCFGEERICYAQNDRRPEKQQRRKKTTIKY